MFGSLGGSYITVRQTPAMSEDAANDAQRRIAEAFKLLKANSESPEAAAMEALGSTYRTLSVGKLYFSFWGLCFGMNFTVFAVLSIVSVFFTLRNAASKIADVVVEIWKFAKGVGSLMFDTDDEARLRAFTTKGIIGFVDATVGMVPGLNLLMQWFGTGQAVASSAAGSAASVLAGPIAGAAAQAAVQALPVASAFRQTAAPQAPSGGGIGGIVGQLLPIASKVIGGALGGGVGGIAGGTIGNVLGGLISDASREEVIDALSASDEFAAAVDVASRASGVNTETLYAEVADRIIG